MHGDGVIRIKIWSGFHNYKPAYSFSHPKGPALDFVSHVNIPIWNLHLNLVNVKSSNFRKGVNVNNTNLLLMMLIDEDDRNAPV